MLKPMTFELEYNEDDCISFLIQRYKTPEGDFWIITNGRAIIGGMNRPLSKSLVQSKNGRFFFFSITGSETLYRKRRYYKKYCFETPEEAEAFWIKNRDKIIATTEDRLLKLRKCEE